MSSTRHAPRALARADRRLVGERVALGARGFRCSRSHVFHPRARVLGGAMFAMVVGAFVIAAALTTSTPLAIALFAMPGLLISQRIGLGGGDLSVSDAALAAAFGTALLLGRRPYSKPLRQLLLINLVYQFATLFTVIVNPYLLNTIEWFHAWMLVSGALIVGWALGAAGYARLALSLLVFTACAIAVAHGH